MQMHVLFAHCEMDEEEDVGEKRKTYKKVT